MATDATAGSRARAVRDPVAAAYLVAVLLGVLQAAVLGEPGRTLVATVPYLLALLVVLAVRAVGPRDRRGLERWLAGLALAGALLAVWLLAAFLLALPDGIGGAHGFYRVKLRVTSPVGDHNTAAGLLLPAIVAAAACAARDRRWLVGLAVATAGLAATLSRAAVLVLLGVAVVGLVVAGRRRLTALVGVSAVAATVLVLAAVLLLDTSPPGGQAAEGRLGASVVGRLELAERGLELARGHPVLGVGLGGFAARAGDLPPPSDHAHQLFAHAAAEGGLGLLGVTVLVPVVLGVRLWRLPAGTRRDVLLLGGLGLVAHAQVEILGGRAGYEVLLALLVALAAPRRARAGAPGVAA